VSHHILHHRPLICPSCEISDPPLGPALAGLMEKSQMLPAVRSEEGVYEQHHGAMSQQCGTMNLVSVSNYQAFAVVGGSSLFGSSSSIIFSGGESPC